MQITPRVQEPGYLKETCTICHMPYSCWQVYLTIHWREMGSEALASQGLRFHHWRPESNRCLLICCPWPNKLVSFLVGHFFPPIFKIPVWSAHNTYRLIWEGRNARILFHIRSVAKCCAGWKETNKKIISVAEPLRSTDKESTCV